MSAIGGKADSLVDPSAGPLIARSGHLAINQLSQCQTFTTQGADIVRRMEGDFKSALYKDVQAASLTPLGQDDRAVSESVRVELNDALKVRHACG